jgi:hypothetical protein
MKYSRNLAGGSIHWNLTRFEVLVYHERERECVCVKEKESR